MGCTCTPRDDGEGAGGGFPPAPYTSIGEDYRPAPWLSTHDELLASALPKYSDRQHFPGQSGALRISTLTNVLQVQTVSNVTRVDWELSKPVADRNAELKVYYPHMNKTMGEANGKDTLTQQTHHPDAQ